MQTETSPSRKSPPAQPANAADWLAATLVEAGVHRVFAYPGDPIIEFMERLRQHEVDVVLARREGTAGFMAEAEAMCNGSIGVCLSTLGPGSTALVNSVAAAQLDRVPMLAVSGQIETARQAVFTHQVVDHERLYAPITKWAGTLRAGAITSTVRKALRTAVAERPGAVHLTGPSDAFTGAVEAETGPLPPLSGSAAETVTIYRAPGAPDPLRLLAGTRRPILLVGIAATRCDAGSQLERLAETAGMPIVVAPMAKGVVPETSPWFAGVLDMACNDLVWDLLADADLIVAAGFDPVELIKPWQLKTTVLHVDTTPNTDQVYPSEVEVVGDVSASIAWLANEFSGEPRRSPDDVAAFRRRLLGGYYSGRVEGRLNPTDVVDVVRACSPSDAIATCDVGSHKLLVGQGWTTHEPRAMLMTNGLSAMGFGVPAAIAAKLVHPDRPVVGIVGDGGFAMTATELRLAAERKLGVTIVVLVDQSLNRIELKQMALGYPSTATRIEEIDIVALAEALDCDGVRAESTRELERALDDKTDSSRPLVVEARIDPSQYESQF
jgi:acetolactate synthase-1/2/3 large subunit